jgi:sulfonate transport system ATP-binding protein
LDVRHVRKDFPFGNGVLKVLEDINLGIEDGEFVSIVGASGCGKSTLLRLITALEEVTEGEILIDGEEVTGPSEKCNMIFQEPRLLPWLSVAGNIGFTIPSHISKKEKKKRVAEHIELVGLTGFEKAVPLFQREKKVRSPVTEKVRIGS